MDIATYVSLKIASAKGSKAPADVIKLLYLFDQTTNAEKKVYLQT
jgi:hypothetical protein